MNQPAKKSFLRFILAAAAVISLSAALGAGSCQSSKTIPLTIFHTNDLHSHLRAAKTDPFGLGGLARLSTLLTGLRAKVTNSITLDAGDWSEGTWYFNVDTGANMLRFLDAMKYDGACLGNHDFLVGPDQLLATLKSAKPSYPVLAANLDMNGYSSGAALTTAMPPYAIRSVGGLKIGLIGLTTYGFVFNGYLTPINITDPIAAATAAAKILRPQVDVLIIISHNDFSLNQEIALAVPGVDALISGHTHIKTPHAVMVVNAGRNVPVVETGYWGKFVGQLDLQVNPDLKSVTFQGFQLHPVTPDIAEDPVVAAMVTAQDQLLNQKAGTDTQKVVAEADLDLIQSDAQESPLGNLAVKAYRSYAQTDLALEEISLTGVSIAQGPATLMDLHDVVPHIYDPKIGKEWTVKVWNARGSDLALIFNVFYTDSGYLALSAPTGWLSADNAVITWDPPHTGDHTFPTITSIQVGGKPLDPNLTYTVALTDGLLTGINTANGALHLGIDVSQISDTGKEAWSAVADYAAAQSHLTLADLRVGNKVHTTGEDLSVHYYAIGWDGKQLSVQVQNEGLKASGASTLTCATGLHDDLVSYDTSEQVWAPLSAGVKLASIPPGASIQTTIPWNQATLAAGYWPVRCAIADPLDSYSPNNSAVRVFKAPMSR